MAYDEMKKGYAPKGDKAMKMKGEMGHSGSVESVQPFDFKGKVKELPMDYRGTTPKAFKYDY